MAAARHQLPQTRPHVLGPRCHLAKQYEAGITIRLLAENTTVSNTARTAAYLRFEAASNDVLGAYRFPWACLYDRGRYPADVLDQVEQVHPHLLDYDGQRNGSEPFPTC